MTPEAFKHYLLDIPDLDAQHWELAEIMNSIRSARQGNNPCMRIRELLQELLEKLLKHFAYEETLMEKIGFPYKEFHCAEHRKLKEDVENIIRTCRVTRCSHRIGLSATLNNIVIAHIEHFDVQIADYMEQHNIALPTIDQNHA